MYLMVSYFVLSFFPRDVLDEICTELSQFLRIFLPTPKCDLNKTINERHARFQPDNRLKKRKKNTEDLQEML